MTNHEITLTVIVASVVMYAIIVAHEFRMYRQQLAAKDAELDRLRLEVAAIRKVLTVPRPGADVPTPGTR